MQFDAGDFRKLLEKEKQAALNRLNTVLMRMNGDIARKIYDQAKTLARMELSESLYEIYDIGLMLIQSGTQYSIQLSQEAEWIEYGRSKTGFMDELLGKGARVSKEGRKYKAIPINPIGSKNAVQMHDITTSLFVRKKAAARGNDIFRVISEKHRNTGKWQHPGSTPHNFIARATETIMDSDIGRKLDQLMKEIEQMES